MAASTAGVNLGEGARLKVTIFPGLNPMSTKSATSTSTAAQEIGPYVRQLAIRRGRTHRLDSFAAGTLNLRLDNNDGRFDPLSTGSTYYPNWKPGLKVMVEGIDNNTTTTGALFVGFLTDAPYTWQDQADGTVTATFADGLSMLEMATIRDGTTLSSGYANVLLSSGLTVAGWPSSTKFRSVSTAKSQIIKTTGADTPFMRIIKKAADSENGMAFVGKDGKFVFRNRGWWQENVTPAAKFGDKSTELPYSDLDIGYDDNQIWNEVIVSRSGSTLRSSYSDTGSVDSYGRRTLSRSGLLLGSSAEADSLAQFLVRRWKEPEARVQRVTFTPKTQKATLWKEAFSREIGDPIRVTRRTQAGNTITRTGYVEKVQHKASVEGDWTTQYELSNQENQLYWQLESSSGYGDLDETTFLGW